jgi:signal transduction histidine kinase
MYQKDKLSSKYSELILYGVVFLVLVATVFVVNINLATSSQQATNQIYLATKLQENWQTSYRHLLATQTSIVEYTALKEEIGFSRGDVYAEIEFITDPKSIEQISERYASEDTLLSERVLGVSKKLQNVYTSFTTYTQSIAEFDKTVQVLNDGGELSLDGQSYSIEQVSDEIAKKHINNIYVMWTFAKDFIKELTQTQPNTLPDQNLLSSAIDFAITKDQSIQSSNRGFIVSLGSIAANRVDNLLLIQIGALALSIIVFTAMSVRLAVSLRKQDDIIRESQSQLIQSEKMASLGQMVAGLAHEMNTPLGFVRNNVEIIDENEKEFIQAHNKIKVILNHLVKGNYDNLEKSLPDTIQKIKHIERVGLFDENATMLQSSLEGLDRIKELIVNLKNFSRLDESAEQMANINECLDSTLVIAHHLLKRHVTVHKQYAQIPETVCSPAQLNQVFLNIISNAAHATEEKGQGNLILKTWAEKDEVVVQISDDGKGIPKQIIDKIFDPFFTTKPVGQGTGLGLSITRKIIEEGHNGRIDVKSRPGEGTDFFIYLPLRMIDKVDTTNVFHSEDAIIH